MVVAIANQKGGVGKSTTALSLAAGLTAARKRVLLIDLDAQINTSATVRASESKPSVLNLIMGDATAAETIQETGGVTIIPGARGLSSMDMILGPKANREYRLKEALSAIVDDYDYILIDTPPSLGVLTINALTAAYGVIIPACAEVYGLQGIAQLYSSILEVRKYPNPNLNVMGILLTRIRQTRLMKDMETLAANVADEIGTVLYKTRIRETTVLKEAQAVQKTIFCYAPSSYGARDYSDFTQEFLLQSKKERKNVKK